MAASTTMSPVSQTLLAYLRAHGPQTTGALLQGVRHMPAVRDVMGADFSLTEAWLNKRLRNLLDLGWLTRPTIDGELQWQVQAERDLSAPRVCQKPVQAPSPRKASKAAQASEPWVGQVAEPRRFNVMGGAGDYKPSWPQHRAGAMDFAAHDSVQFGQRVPYRGVSSSALPPLSLKGFSE